jgi:hypothetical protein
MNPIIIYSNNNILPAITFSLNTSARTYNFQGANKVLAAQLHTVVGVIEPITAFCCRSAAFRCQSCEHGVASEATRMKRSSATCTTLKVAIAVMK